MKLYAEYIKEREDTNLLQLEHAFATYKKINNETYYIIDVYVEKGFRRDGLATKLSAAIEEIAKKDGATKLLGSVDLSRNGATESMQAILSNGFKFSHTNGNGLFFIKEIEV